MENEKETTLSETEILSRICDLQKKQVKIAKITAALIMVFVVTVIIVVLILVPKAFNLMEQVNTTVDKANGAIDSVTDTIQRAETTLDGIDQMTESASEAASNMNQLVEENSKTLNESITALSEIDYEGLNEAIGDLKDSANSMSQVMSIFGK
jgi:predicted PurR-regulated permease PerM